MGKAKFEYNRKKTKTRNSRRGWSEWNGKIQRGIRLKTLRKDK